MRNLFKFMVFGMLVFSQVEGCQKCFNECLLAHQSMDSITEKIKNEKKYDVSDDFLEGYRRGCKMALKTALKIINQEHPETKFSFDD